MRTLKTFIKKGHYYTLAAFMGVSTLLVTPFAQAVSPIQIHNCVELQAIGLEHDKPLNGSYKLANDINCAGSIDWNEDLGFRPIGPDGDNMFTGTFDGDGKTISNLAITRPHQSYVGLFGRTDQATIKNVNLINARITGQDTVGSLAGRVDSSTIERVSVANTNGSAKVTANGQGEGEGEAISIYAGGLIGVSHNSSISNAYARTNVYSNYEGWVSLAGILIGMANGSSGGVTNTYASGELQGTINNSGPLFGSMYYDLEISNNYWDSSAYGDGPGQTDLGNNDGGRTPVWLKTKSNLVSAGWDFDNVWQITEANDGFPSLKMPVIALDASTDRNGDGIADNTQANVVATTSSVSGKPVALEMSGACVISEAVMKTLQQVNSTDTGYTYPQGLMDFTANCGTSGFTSTVKQYYYNVPLDSNLVLRKYNPHTKQFMAIPGASLTQQTIHGQQVIVASYQVTDGGALDADGTVNGIIIDPAGIATAAGAPNTGLRKQNLSILAGFVTIGAILMLYAARRNSAK